MFLSYSDLNTQANILARSLRAKLRDISFLRSSRSTSEGESSLDSYVELEEKIYEVEETKKRYVVAVDMEPGHTLIVSILAVMKLGAAYMPLDATSAINRVII